MSAKQKQGKFVPERISRPINKKSKRKEEKNEFLSWIFSLFIAVAIALALRFFVFDFVVVEGTSMEPTLYSGEVVFVEKLSYRVNEPNIGDIVISRYDENKKNYVKRVLGNSGDIIEINQGELYINDRQIIEPYIKEEMIDDLGTVVVPNKTVFLMGDNRNNSFDSRIDSVGAIDLKKVRGRALFRCWPFSRFGKIDE